MKSTKILALLLVLAMCFGMLASCNLFKKPDPTPEGPDNGGNGGNTGDPEKPDENVYPYDIYAGDPTKDYRDPGFYTSLDYMGGTTGLNWNPHTWETNDDSYVLGYLQTPLYDFVLNGEKNGYTIIPEAAAELPVDVTADYVGKYGISEGEEGKAWLIKLNPLVTWNDGTKINAETYVYSMQSLLDPVAVNRRADSFYAGDFEIVNAKAYFYSGKTVWVDTIGGEELNAAAGTTASGAPAQIACDKPLDWLGGYSLAFYVSYYTGAGIFDETAFASLAALDTDSDGLVELNEESLALLVSVITFSADWGETAADAVNYIYAESSYPETSFEEVGCVAVSEYELLLVTANPVEEAGFYVPYNLSSYPLVKNDLYESCQTWYDKDGNVVPAGSENVFSMTTTYCTTIDTTVSYGPYNFTKFELDKQLTFERNENWFGYHDGLHYGQYQTDKISCQVITEHKTALQAFLAGEIDGVGMDSSDMEIYASSDRLLYTPESYTTKLTFNTDKAKLEEIGKYAVVLTIPEFREAFSLAINREVFCSSFTASHEPGYGLLNYMYCYNPFTGELYRDSDYAKKALVDLYGIEYGDGKEYADLEEAYDAITGYDPTKANALMKTAGDKAIADGLWDGTSEVVLDFRVYSSDEIYVKMFTFFDEALKEVCKNTAFEGKIKLQMTEDPDYYESMYSGNATIIFSTWGGAAMAPFSMLSQVYCDAADGSGNQNEYGFHTENISVTITVDGKEVTTSLKAWADWCNGAKDEKLNAELGNFADYEYDVRCEIFAELEYVYLSHFTAVPLYYRNGASLLSRKVDYATTDYLQIVGYGGLRYMTYNYTDAEWDAVKGNINY